MSYNAAQSSRSARSDSRARSLSVPPTTLSAALCRVRSISSPINVTVARTDAGTRFVKTDPRKLRAFSHSPTPQTGAL